MGKKKLISLGLILTMTASMFAGCGSSDDADDSKPSKVATAEDNEEVNSGRVYFYNFKPEQKEAYEKAAQAFMDENKGIKVTVETAASNQYQTSLTAEITKDEAPTLFIINGPAGYNSWKDYCAELTDTKLAKMIKDDGFTVKSDGKVYGLASCLEGYGLIYNKEIIDKYCALDGALIKSVDDIKDYETLNKVATDMTAKKADLGIDAAFASTTMEKSDNWRWVTHLNNLPLYYEFKDNGITDLTDTIEFKYADNYKKVLDMYLKNDIADERGKSTDDSVAQFALGRCAFVQNGSWAWTTVSKTKGNVVKAENCGFLPIYCGVDDANEGICVGTEVFYAINAKASEEDQKATVKFLEWLYTSESGMKILKDDLQFISPFNNEQADTSSDNPLINQIASDSAAGKVTPWVFQLIPSEDFKQEFGSQLKAYAENMTDDNWANVVKTYKDSWASQMEIVRSETEE